MGEIFGVLLVFVFFSIPSGKRDMYILPALPMLCLALAPLLPGILRKPNAQRLLAGFVAVFSLALLGAAHAFERFGGLAPCNLCLKQREVYWGAVLIALLAPLAAQGDGGAKLALLVTAGVALVLKKPLPAISAGIVAAALFRQKIRLLTKRLWLSISRKRRIMSLLCSSTS